LARIRVPLVHILEDVARWIHEFAAEHEMKALGHGALRFMGVSVSGVDSIE